MYPVSSGAPWRVNLSENFPPANFSQKSSLWLCDCPMFLPCHMRFEVKQCSHICRVYIQWRAVTSKHVRKHASCNLYSEQFVVIEQFPPTELCPWQISMFKHKLLLAWNDSQLCCTCSGDRLRHRLSLAVIFFQCLNDLMMTMFLPFRILVSCLNPGMLKCP